ncbi:MAG: hypothetical protein R6T83_12100 [Salinibacter sp.]
MPPNDSSLTRYLDTLYPVACMLAGPDTADTLLRHAFEQAATTPPKDRPSDRQAWLLRLLIDVHSQTARAGGGPGTSPDALRRAVAEEAVDRALPAAFASGSETDRLVLLLDALDAPTETLTQVLQTSPKDAEAKRTQAWTHLSDRLQNALRGPERALVEEAISKEHLRAVVREDVAGRFQTPPASLRSVLRAILQRGEADLKRRDDTDAASADDPSSSPPGPPPSTSDDEPSSGWPLRRTVVGGVLLVLLVAGAVFGMLQLQSSPSPAVPTLPSLSASAADTLSPRREMTEPAAARSYIQATWQRRVAVPSIDGATLQGIGHLQFKDADVPGLVFADEDASTTITVLAYNYALLDGLGDDLQIEDDLRTGLANNEGLLPRSESGDALVLWRQRDDILVAVASHLSPEALEARIVLARDSAR